MIDTDTLKALAQAGGSELRVSVFIESDPPGATRQAPTKLKNLLRGAQDRLEGLGCEEREAKTLLQPASAYLDDEAFWQGRSEQAPGIGLFLSGEGLEHLVEVHTHPREAFWVGRRFWLKPLYGDLQGAHFYVLALSQHRVRLADCTRTRAEDATPRDLPESLTDLVGSTRVQDSLQFRSAGRGANQRGDSVIYHGQGAGDDDAKAEQRRFARAVSEALAGTLAPGTPLVLAATEPMASVFRNTAPADLIAETLPGNPDHLSLEELRVQALPLMETHWAKCREDALRALETTIGQRAGASEFQPVLRAIVEGRVERLYAAADRELEGGYDPDDDRVLLPEELAEPAECHDLFDLCLGESLVRGATVGIAPAAKIPGTTGVAAGFR